MLAELAGVLDRRARFAVRLAAAVPPATPEALLQRYTALATIVVARADRAHRADADADDDMVIATALAARADADRHGRRPPAGHGPLSRDTDTRKCGGVGERSQETWTADVLQPARGIWPPNPGRADGLHESRPSRRIVVEREPGLKLVRRQRPVRLWHPPPGFGKRRPQLIDPRVAGEQVPASGLDDSRSWRRP